MNNKEKRTLVKIKDHAVGSLYRMNASSADCYAFDFTDNGKDWTGGWDWSNQLVDSEAEYILMLNTLEVKKIN